MKPCQVIGPLLLVGLCAPALHAKDKKPSVPAVFGQAHYVYVEAVDGKEFDQNLDPEDRIAIADVRDAFANWKRYTVTAEREQADLVIVVRKGRVASTNAGVSRGGGPDSGPGSGSGAGEPFPGPQQRAGVPAGGPAMGGTAVQMGGEAGPANDLFEVCPINVNGKRGSPLWERTMPDGLSTPRIVLFQQFKEAVDKAYPNPPAGQTAGQPANQPTSQGQKP